jgi:hypothetical protein
VRAGYTPQPLRKTRPAICSFRCVCNAGSCGNNYTHLYRSKRWDASRPCYITPYTREPCRSHGCADDSDA